MEKKISLEATPKARAFLAEIGYDPLFGARPLKRTIQNLVQNPLAKMVLAGDLPDGGSVTIDKGTDGIVFRKK